MSTVEAVASKGFRCSSLLGCCPNEASNLQPPKSEATASKQLNTIYIKYFMSVNWTKYGIFICYPAPTSPGLVSLHFVPGHFVPGHFVPVISSPGHFVPRSFRPRVISSPWSFRPLRDKLIQLLMHFEVHTGCPTRLYFCDANLLVETI